jgi:hypothetical protein
MRQELMSGLSAAGTALAVLAPKCPFCVAAYAGPAGLAVAAGVVGAGVYGVVRRLAEARHEHAERDQAAVDGQAARG